MFGFIGWLGFHVLGLGIGMTKYMSLLPYSACEILADVFVIYCRKGKFKDNQPKINSTPHRENKSAGREYPAERKFSLGGSWHVMSSFSVMNTSMKFL